jgi:hypothetical protein
MSDSNKLPIRFAPVEGQTIRGDFDGGALSSDMGPMLLRSIDQQIGLTERLAATLDDRRHPAYVQHELADLLAQRVYQTASAYADGNDADTLRHDPMFQMGLGRRPLEAHSVLASGATFSRLENSVSTKDIFSTEDYGETGLRADLHDDPLNQIGHMKDSPTKPACNRSLFPWIFILLPSFRIAYNLLYVYDT